MCSYIQIVISQIIIIKTVILIKLFKTIFYLNILIMIIVFNNDYFLVV